MPQTRQIDARAICDSPHVGAGTRVRAFACIHSGARVGSDCDIHSGVVVDSGAVLGSRVTVNSGVQIGADVRIEDDVFIGSNVSFSTDLLERVTNPEQAGGPIVVSRGAKVGANATLLPGVTIGSNAVIAPGTVVAKSVPPFAIAGGNPARVTGYLGGGSPLTPTAASVSLLTNQPIRVPGVTLHELPVVRDIRGDLAVCEFATHMPFAPRRYFVVFNVPSSESRGAHAHRQCAQLLVAMHGSIAVVVDDGDCRQEVVLDSPRLGLHIPPMVWGIQYRYSASAVLLVLASHPYAADDYIRDYDTFCKERRATA